MDFPSKLCLLCRQRGWSQRELADAVGDVSKSTVSNWMSGKTDPRRLELSRLAALFNVPVQYLVLDEIEEPGGDGLGESVRRILWAAETVGYEIALRRIMNAPALSAPEPQPLDRPPAAPTREGEGADGPARKPSPLRAPGGEAPQEERAASRERRRGSKERGR